MDGRRARRRPQNPAYRPTRPSLRNRDCPHAHRSPTMARTCDRGRGMRITSASMRLVKVAVGRRSRGQQSTIRPAWVVVAVLAFWLSGCASSPGQDQSGRTPKLTLASGAYIVDPGIKSPALPTDRPIGTVLFAYAYKGAAFLVTAEG